MNKVPVFATALAAYRYTFANYTRVFGIFWLPTVLLLGLVFALFLPLFDSMREAAATQDAGEIFTLLGLLLLLELLALALMIVATVGVTRLVLDRKVEWPYFYFSFGGDFWRLLGGDLLVALILFAALFGMGMVLSVVIFAAVTIGGGGDPTAFAAAIQRWQPLTAVVMYAVMAFFIIRLAILLPSIVICETRVSLARNWELTRGHFWRILGVVALIVLPGVALGILQMVLLSVFGDTSLNALAMWGTPQDQAAWSQAVMDLYRTYWYLYAVLGLVLTPLFYGPLIASSAMIYRHLVPEQAAS